MNQSRKRDAVRDPRGLTEREHRAWHGVLVMQEGLAEYLDRQVRNQSGLSRSDFRVLGHLFEALEGRLRQNELGRLLRWHKSRVSQQLSRMESRGLVSREPSRSDQRGAVVAITDTGVALVETLAPLHVADVRAALIDHLSDEELDLLADVGDLVRERLAGLEPALAEYDF